MTSGISAIDASLQKTHAWLKDLMAELGWNNPQRAYSGLRAVLHALRDRLTLEEAMHLGAELPMILRGACFEGWDFAKGPGRERTREDFLTRVAGSLLQVPEVDPERLTRAVFRVLSRRVSSGEAEDVRRMLPGPIRELWPEAAPSPAAPVRVGRRGRPATLRRARARKAKEEIRTVIARARARGARAQDLPVLVSRRDLRKGRRAAPEGG
jgi:uncharacterized protein (DUF2267 family)